jgi:hypothetical protein
MSAFVKVIPSSMIETYVNLDNVERISFLEDGAASVWFDGCPEPVKVRDLDSVGRLKVAVGGVIRPEIRDPV